MQEIAVLGLGYAGVRIFQECKSIAHAKVRGFSARTQILDSALCDFGSEAQLKDFLHQFENNPFDQLIITFPLQKLQNSESVIGVISKVSKNFWLLGTTSIYKRVPDITEISPKDPLHDRYQLEEQFLQAGGKVLRLCGIYGSGRNPGNWARAGKVQKSKRQVNLIHGDDIAKTVRTIFEFSEFEYPSELILSDNQWHTWFEIFRFLEDMGKIDSRPEQEPDREDAFVDSRLIRKILPGLQTKDFWQELEKLEESNDLRDH
ncbi:hypothetical protein CH373_08155 [Leptospira perolatii]|uniref:NAD(P)-dependent oxidoreductase n=1 Tax=Leptospira perolatii TaxID=2023191 RepID=A0A2M9ZN42_9LEPT|nr:hypothetical protein [Leptospira perolatii]PJZ68904.1 hypothetical protein CH360_13560 [Leptospira perolatii]PJZ73477.1 hypothetical protein CH373_08155 [Leptospira perolatii]